MYEIFSSLDRDSYSCSDRLSKKKVEIVVGYLCVVLNPLICHAVLTLLCALVMVYRQAGPNWQRATYPGEQHSFTFNERVR